MTDELVWMTEEDLLRERNNWSSVERAARHGTTEKALARINVQKIDELIRERKGSKPMTGKWLVIAKCNGWLKVGGEAQTLDDAKKLAAAIMARKGSQNPLPPKNCDLSSNDFEYLTDVSLYSLSHFVTVQTTVFYNPV